MKGPDVRVSTDGGVSWQSCPMRWNAPDAKAMIAADLDAWVKPVHHLLAGDQIAGPDGLMMRRA